MSEERPAPRAWSARRVGLHAALWAGPVGAVLALILLVASAPFFRSGPGVPTAGDPRAWSALWGALFLVCGGFGAASIANLAWLVVTLRAGRRPNRFEWMRTIANGLPGIALACWFLLS